MEKFRFIIFVVLLVIGGILVYTLSKSLFMLDRGIRVKEEVGKKSTKEPVHTKKNDSGFEDARIIFGNYLYYAVDLTHENGGDGPEEIQSKAKNLVFINIKNGRLKKLFQDNVYIHDFFPGTFTRNKEIRVYDEPEHESVDIGEKLIIFAVVNDTNDDGFLNGKDSKKVFLYDPQTEKLTGILPGNYYFEKLFYNSAKNYLSLLVKKISPASESKNTDEEENTLFYFLYSVSKNRGRIVSPVL